MDQIYFIKACFLVIPALLLGFMLFSGLRRALRVPRARV